MCKFQVSRCASRMDNICVALNSANQIGRPDFTKVAERYRAEHAAGETRARRL